MSTANQLLSVAAALAIVGSPAVVPGSWAELQERVKPKLERRAIQEQSAARGTPPRVVPHAPADPDPDGTYLFYLHGRIVEEQGADAVSAEHGRYEYAAILDRLAHHGMTVISEARRRDTDPKSYAGLVADQVRRLLNSRVPPRNITIVGASKGSVIAMLVSTQVVDRVRYVLMANCNDYVLRTFPIRLHGDVLSIYESSDPLGQSCNAFFAQSPDLGRRKEVRLDTGLRHGFIFRPLEEWVRPALEWARADVE